MIGGGDVSPFAGIFSILTIFMVAAAVGLIVGVVIMIVLAVKNRASQNNMAQTMPMKRYCIKCGARIEEGTAFCGKCGASLQSFPPVQEKAEVHTGRENAAAQGQTAANPGPKPAAAPGGQNAGQRPPQYGQPQPRYQPQPAAYGMGYNIPIKNYDPSKDYTPISMWGYFGYQLLFAIPLIGQIIILIFAFGGTKNINLRNYARSTFCLFIICLVVVLLIVLFVAIASASAY